jgi:hypothetical protein
VNGHSLGSKATTVSSQSSITSGQSSHLSSSTRESFAVVPTPASIALTLSARIIACRLDAGTAPMRRGSLPRTRRPKEATLLFSMQYIRPDVNAERPQHGHGEQKVELARSGVSHASDSVEPIALPLRTSKPPLPHDRSFVRIRTRTHASMSRPRAFASQSVFQASIIHPRRTHHVNDHIPNWPPSSEAIPSSAHTVHTIHVHDRP